MYVNGAARCLYMDLVHRLKLWCTLHVNLGSIGNVNNRNTDTLKDYTIFSVPNRCTHSVCIVSMWLSDFHRDKVETGIYLHRQQYFHFHSLSCRVEWGVRLSIWDRRVSADCHDVYRWKEVVKYLIYQDVQLRLLAAPETKNSVPCHSVSHVPSHDAHTFTASRVPTKTC